MEILDQTGDLSNDRLLPMKTGLYLLIMFAMAVFNTLMLAYHNSGFRKVSSLLLGGFVTFVFVLPVACIVLALIVALIPYKDQPYARKYWPATALCYFVINSLAFIFIGIGSAVIALDNLF